MAEVSEEFDFLQGSMKDLAMKMGEIDDVLAEISAPEASKPVENEKKADIVDDDDDSSYKDDEILPVNHSFDDAVADYDDDDDSDDGGLTDLQGELRQFEEMDRKQVDAVMRGEPTKVIETPVLAIVNKPAPTSPVGISMKTSKGITRIVGISPEGLLANTDLRVGHILVKINSVYIKNAKHARYIIQNASDKVCLEAKLVTEL